MKIIIGITGVKTAGKTTVASMIKKFVVAEEIALADKLKNVCSTVFRVPRDHFDSQEFKEVKIAGGLKFLTKNAIAYILSHFDIPISEVELNIIYEKFACTSFPTPRKIAQIIGTELLRELGGEDIHCNNVKICDDKITIISDLRFPNEFDYFNNLDDTKFIPLYIQRDVAEKLVDMEKSHPSETLLFTFNKKCVKIDNNGSFENTEKQVKEVLDKELN